MSLGSHASKPAYLIYAILSLLVVCILAWATDASLRLNRTTQEMALQKEYDNKIRLAVYRMETLVGAMLSGELRREYWNYTPFHYPNTRRVRFASGETFDQGAIVQPSPLLLTSPPEWILLHFQGSPRAGQWRSPQLLPEEAFSWPDFEDAYDTWDREPFERMLRTLEDSYSIDELAQVYDHAANEYAEAMHRSPSGTGEDNDIDSGTAVASGEYPSDYSHRRSTTELVQNTQSPQQACEPQNLAYANIHAESHLVDDLASDLLWDDEEVGINYQRMLPVWVTLVGRAEQDLALLRTVEVNNEIAVQGCIIDWPRFRSLLLGTMSDVFPDATLEPIQIADRKDVDSVLSGLPVRLVTNASLPAATEPEWTTTHTVLAVCWVVCLTLLTGLGLGIRSLIALSDRRSQFAYAVTHELRTPLTTFRLYTDMLAGGLVPEENRQEYLDTLNGESRRLADLVSGVLEYSRVENRNVPIIKEKTTVGKILESVSNGCVDHVSRSGGKLTVDGGDQLEKVVHTDPQLVGQIVGNLIDNACKYGRSDGEAEIRLQAGGSNGTCHIDVSDNGPGVSSRNRSTIFKPYQRGDADPTTVKGGLGLGLALSRSWAKLLGGRLELLPKPRGGTGATFRLTLPTGE